MSRDYESSSDMSAMPADRERRESKGRTGHIPGTERSSLGDSERSREFESIS